MESFIFLSVTFFSHFLLLIEVCLIKIFTYKYE